LIPFSGSPLDRAAHLRLDGEWLAARRRDPASLILPMSRLEALVTGDPLRAAFLAPEFCEGVAASDAVCVFLGLDGGRACFALDVAEAERAVLGTHGEFRELRGVAALLPAKDLAILGQAKATVDWHLRHGFCAKCGATSAPAEGGHKRVCAVCGAEHFPRTDPVVIMLATQGGMCLLGRGRKWPPNFYSCLAGFMEPGEDIEEAVRRELFEEAGVVAGRVDYFASQPWPFPSQLMIGCFAEVEGRALKLDNDELADARWLTREEARALLKGEFEGLRAPPAFAIAHHLIKAWVG
jgi:NAD+ diphosphatase